MGVSAHEALVLLALIASGATLLVLAPVLRLPYPILLVLGGLALGFVPGIPHPTLKPEIVLVAILPPLLYASAFFTSLRDLRRNVRPLSLMAVGLVLATTVSVAAVCHALIDGLSWPVSFVIGAIVAPTDAGPAPLPPRGPPAATEPRPPLRPLDELARRRRPRRQRRRDPHAPGLDVSRCL